MANNKINTRPKTIGTTVTSTTEPESRDTGKHKWLKARVQQNLQGINKQHKDFWLKQNTQQQQQKLINGTRRQLEQQWPQQKKSLWTEINSGKR